jgi:RHS repeat-associated protein
MTQYKFNVGSNAVTGALTWNPNGTLGQLAITDPLNSSNAQTCNYTHDDLTRIASANCGSIWSQTFTFDAFGNINKTGNSSFNPSYSTATNRMTQIGSSTPTYDANGNVTNDFLHTYAWDSNGRPVTIDGIVATYDALGRMVELNRSGVYGEIVYAPSGDKLALMNGQSLLKAFVPLTGGATAVYSSGGLAYYRHSDGLGSSRLATTPSQTMYSDVAYAPYGETYAQAGNADFSFTGMNEDVEQNANPATLYDFLAREYGIQGRWPSPDPAGLLAVDPRNPQSWNRYAYVLNNPLAMTDPTGMEGIICADPTSCIIESIIMAIVDIFQFLISPPPPPQAAPAPPGGYGGGIDAYGTFDEGVPSGVQVFPSAFPGSGTTGGLPGLANAGFGDGLPGALGTAGTICLFVPVCGEIEIGTVGTVIIVGGVIVATGAIIHEGVKDRVFRIPPITLAKGGKGNVADTGIMQEVHDMIAAGIASSVCDALQKLYDASSGTRRNKIKATQKAKGCRGH